MKKFNRFSSVLLIAFVWMFSLSSCTNMYDPERDDYLYAESSEDNGNSAESSSESSKESSSDASRESSAASSSESSSESSVAASSDSSQSASSESSEESSQSGNTFRTADEITKQIDAIDGYHAPKNWQRLYPNGSADSLSGTIAVVSIFISVGDQIWDYSVEADYKAYSRAFYNLKYATEFLKKECESYGKTVNFIWDWTYFERLYYKTTLDVEYDDILADNGILCDALWEFIDNNVNSEGIRQVFGADSVIYMAYLDSPEGNTDPSCTRDFYGWMPYPYEICYINMRNSRGLTVPAVIAHEMLHTFGAPDLYWTSSYSVFELDYGITKEFTDYVQSIELNDIMRITWDPQSGQYLTKSIAQHITEISAYYAGLIDHSDLVDEWGFDPSDHVRQ